MRYECVPDLSEARDADVPGTISYKTPKWLERANAELEFVKTDQIQTW
jgi:hypothetical protein